MLVAPYFSFEQRGDRWHQLDLRLVADTVALANRPVDRVRADTAALRSGQVRDAAPTARRPGRASSSPRRQPRSPDRRRDNDHRLPAGAGCNGGRGSALRGRRGGALRAGRRWGDRRRVLERRASPSVHPDPGPIYAPTDEMYSRQWPTVPGRWYSISHAPDRAAAMLRVSCRRARSPAVALAAGTGPSDLTEHLVHYFTVGARQAAAAGASRIRASLTATESNAPRPGSARSEPRQRARVDPLAQEARPTSAAAASLKCGAWARARGRCSAQSSSDWPAADAASAQPASIVSGSIAHHRSNCILEAACLRQPRRSARPYWICPREAVVVRACHVGCWRSAGRDRVSLIVNQESGYVGDGARTFDRRSR